MTGRWSGFDLITGQDERAERRAFLKGRVVDTMFCFKTNK